MWTDIGTKISPFSDLGFRLEWSHLPSLWKTPIETSDYTTLIQMNKNKSRFNEKADNDSYKKINLYSFIKQKQCVV